MFWLIPVKNKWYFISISLSIYRLGGCVAVVSYDSRAQVALEFKVLSKRQKLFPSSISVAWRYLWAQKSEREDWKGDETRRQGETFWRSYTIYRERRGKFRGKKERMRLINQWKILGLGWIFVHILYPFLSHCQESENDDECEMDQERWLLSFRERVRG